MNVEWSTLRQELVIGKSEVCDIYIGGRYADNQHARLTFDGEEVTIEDLGSQFGTFVNGKRIEDLTPLQEKDKVKIGTQLFDWESYRQGVEEAEYDSNPIYFKDLVTSKGEISKSNYRFLLLFTLISPLVIIFGVPYILMLLDFLTRKRFSDYLSVLIEPIWYILGVIVAYIFVMQSIKRINTLKRR